MQLTAWSHEVTSRDSWKCTLPLFVHQWNLSFSLIWVMRSVYSQVSPWWLFLYPKIENLSPFTKSLVKSTQKQVFWASSEFSSKNCCVLLYSVLLIMTLLQVCWPACAEPSTRVSSGFMASLPASSITELVGAELLHFTHPEMSPFPFLPPPLYHPEISNVEGSPAVPCSATPKANRKAKCRVVCVYLWRKLQGLHFCVTEKQHKAALKQGCAL